MTMRSSSIDVHTINTNKKSITYIPKLTKTLQIGPQNTNTEPSPATYTQKNTKPTITNTNVVLNYLPSNTKLGNNINLDYNHAEQTINTITQTIKLSIQNTTKKIVNIINENMFKTLHLISIEQNFDPKNFALITFGGTKPLHTNTLNNLMNS